MLLPICASVGSNNEQCEFFISAVGRPTNWMASCQLVFFRHGVPVLAPYEKAVKFVKRFRLSWYDASMVAAAILSGTTLLLSEDMQS